MGSSLSSAEEPRAWTANSGHSLQAKLVAVAGGKAQLRTPTGQLFEIAINALQAADQARVRQFQTARSPSHIAEMQRLSAEAMTALGNRDLQRAEACVAQLQDLATTADLAQEAVAVIQAVHDLDAFWNTYQQGAQQLQAGDRLTLRAGIGSIASTLDQRVVLTLGGRNYDFDTTRWQSIPHELVIAIARLTSDDAPVTRRSLRSFRVYDSGTRDPTRWQAAERVASPVAN